MLIYMSTHSKRHGFFVYFFFRKGFQAYLKTTSTTSNTGILWLLCYLRQSYSIKRVSPLLKMSGSCILFWSTVVLWWRVGKSCSCEGFCSAWSERVLYDSGSTLCDSWMTRSKRRRKGRIWQLLHTVEEKGKDMRATPYGGGESRL